MGQLAQVISRISDAIRLAERIYERMKKEPTL